MRVTGNPRYPRNWKRVSKTLRRVIGHCERCKNPSNDLAVHHKGTAYPTGKPGDAYDKHDLRRENLEVICFRCHDEIENVGAINHSIAKKRKRKRERLEAHRSLGIGVGLVLYQQLV